MIAPRVSVILPVYNGGKALQKALQSICGQTFTDLEIIVIDDGSTDGTASYLDSVNDPRLKVLHLNHCGLTGALNAGLEEARGEFVARQDADDVSFPERIANQVAYLNSHPEVALVGAQAEIRDPFGHRLGLLLHPATPATVHWRLLFDCPIVHSLACFRREVIDGVGRYRIHCAEDYDLWWRISEQRLVSNLPSILLLYTTSPQGFTSMQRAQMVANHLTISTVHIKRILMGSRWIDQAGNLASIFIKPQAVPAADATSTACALLDVRRRFELQWQLRGKEDDDRYCLTSDDRAYICQDVWRFISDLAILHASWRQRAATAHLWNLSRAVSPSSMRSFALACLLAASILVGGKRVRWIVQGSTWVRTWRIRSL